MTITVDSSGFTAMTRELARISGKTHRDVIRSETGRVLETAMKWTGEADKKARVRVGVALQERTGTWDATKKISINSGVRGPAGRAWYSQSSTETWKYTHYIVRGPWGPRPLDPPSKSGKTRNKGSGPMKWPNRIWADAARLLTAADREVAFIEKENAARRGGKRKKDKTIKGRGLAKQSWVQIADTLGIPLRGVSAAVRNAIPQDGLRRQSGEGRELEIEDAFFVEVENRYPFLLKGRSIRSGTGKFDGKGILSRAIKSRVTSFGISLKKGIFRDLKLRAARYPGLFSVS